MRRYDFEATLRFAVLNGLSKRAHLTGLRASPEMDMVIQDVIEELFVPHLRWAVKAKLAALDGGRDG
jgi:hypothetical protein